jgi:hypothetical protein
VKLEELTYYLIENPLKAEKIAVTDKYALSQILKVYEKIGLKKRLHTPTEDKEKIEAASGREKVLEAENLIQVEYAEEAGDLFGSGIFSLGIGVTLTYLLFKPLFDLGAYGPPRYRVESAYEVPIEQVPPEVVNNPEFIDPAGKLFSRLAGTLLGILPFLVGLYLGVKHVRRPRTYKRFSERVDHLKNLELEIIPTENVSAFQKESEYLINETREYSQKFHIAESREQKLQICSKIEGNLRRINNLSKSQGCEEVSSYYEELECSLAELKSTMKKPRFWKSEKRYVNNLFGDETY